MTQLITDKLKTRYKFLHTDLKSENGSTKWRKGVWQHCEGELNMCRVGFHCSKQPYDAFSYVQGEILALVEVKGKSIIQDNKECWSDMRVVKAYKWTKKDSLKLAIFSAELCLKNFEEVYPDDERPRQAIEAVKKVLFHNTKKNQAAAVHAVHAAVHAAAYAAADAAYAAHAAAHAAAYAAHAAHAAAYAAAYATHAAMIKQIQRYFMKLVKGLKEI